MKQPLGITFLLAAFLLAPGAQADSSIKRSRAFDRSMKRAIRIGKTLQGLSIALVKKSYTPIKQKRAPKRAPFNGHSQFQKISYQTELRIVRVHALIEQGERLVRATPASLPVRGRISSKFGNRRHPRSQDYKHHAGIDIVARLGSPVVATADGRVVFSGVREGYGKVVVVDHGFGYQTVYAHNSRLSVPVGVRVVRGQQIAHVGATGHTTGAHLHYEVRKNGVPVDPQPYLKPKRLQASS